MLLSDSLERMDAFGQKSVQDSPFNDVVVFVSRGGDLKNHGISAGNKCITSDGGQHMEAFSFTSISQCVAYLSEHRDRGHVVFAGPDTVKAIAVHAGDGVVLCSTAGEYTPEGYKKEAITGFSYNRSMAELVRIDHPPVKSVESLKKAYQKVKGNSNAFMLLLCDGLGGMEESIITTFYFTDDTFKIVGGSAGDNLKFEETQIFIGNQKVCGAAVFFNTKQRTQIIKENIYVPIGKRLLVTDADPISRTVRTFNNLPASTEYARVLGVAEKELSTHFMNNPLGKKVEQEIYIASPMKVNPDKSITFYCQIMPNTFVEVLKPGNLKEILRDTLSSASFKPSFVLAVNCILRSLKFQQENLWGTVDSSLLGFCRNTTGFISYGEQYYKHHLNQTMVLLLME